MSGDTKSLIGKGANREPRQLLAAPDWSAWCYPTSSESRPLAMPIYVSLSDSHFPIYVVLSSWWGDGPVRAVALLLIALNLGICW